MKPVAGQFVDLETRDPIGCLSRFVGARASTDQTQIRIRLRVLFFLSVIAPFNRTEIENTYRLNNLDTGAG